MIALGEH